jgi:hypothetical protein
MAGRFLAVGCLAAVVVVVPVLAEAEEENMERVTATRSFERFEFDTETVDGFWAEAGGQFSRDSDQNIDDPQAFARLAYGQGKRWEAGLRLPYQWQDGPDGQGIDANGLGDLQLSGKYIPLRGQILDVGGGAVLSLPSGRDKEGFGEGQVGGGPFLTGSVNLDMARFYAHIGSEFFAGSGDGLQAENRMLYGFALMVPIGKQVVLRNEFTGVRYYNADGTPKVVNYRPGVDVRVPLGAIDVVLRPTGLVGITDRAPDWGFGGSLTITSPTLRTAKKDIGDIFIEE